MRKKIFKHNGLLPIIQKKATNNKKHNKIILYVFFLIFTFNTFLKKMNRINLFN